MFLELRKGWVEEVGFKLPVMMERTLVKWQ